MKKTENAMSHGNSKQMTQVNLYNLLAKIFVLIVLAASCGHRQPKTSVSEDNVGATLAEAPLAGDHHQQQINDEDFCQLMQEIIYKMPEAHMPDYLKTEEQRREALASNLGEDSDQSAFSLYRLLDAGYDQWTVAGFLTEDNRNVLLIVQYGSGLDGFQLKSDKTLNYHIETQAFNEIERPIELPTVDEIILESIFDTARLFQRAKTHFGNKMEWNYGNFYKEGFTVIPNYFTFWLNNDDFDYYGAPFMIAWYKWDGKQFNKYKILNYNDFENERLIETEVRKNDKHLSDAFQNSPSPKTRHYQWIGEEGEEIIMTQFGNVFRGEYIDPGFQERASVPIVGTIDKEGNVYGTGFDMEDGSLYAQFTGKITGYTFVANWGPVPNAISEHRSWNLKQQQLSPETEREIAKHPDAFYNHLFPELDICTSSGTTLNRVTPFLPEEVAVAGGHLYGHQIGEWELKRLFIAPTTTDGEIFFHLQIEINGHFWIEVNIQDTARLSGNTFRYRQKDYEFEVAIYNGFAAITTIAGFIDLSAQEDVSEGANKVDDNVEFKADGVYPLLSNGFVDKQFYEINFYCDKNEQ